jgi:hypothetical protein
MRDCWACFRVRSNRRCDLGARGSHDKTGSAAPSQTRPRPAGRPPYRTPSPPHFHAAVVTRRVMNTTKLVQDLPDDLCSHDRERGVRSLVGVLPWLAPGTPTPVKVAASVSIADLGRL